MSNHKWYVVHVYSGFEKEESWTASVSKQPRRVAEQFSELLVPTEQVMEVRRGRK